MKYTSVSRYLVILFLVAYLYLPVVFAASDPYVELKSTGVSLEWYQHELDFDITKINATVPGVSSDLLNSANSQLDSLNKVTLYNIRLDHQIRPYLNIYGAIGKVKDTTGVRFSGLNLGVTDLVVGTQGNAYTLGTLLNRKKGNLITSLEIIHSRIHLDNNDEEIVVNTAVPSVGISTGYGIFSLSFSYQAIEARYSGIVSAPIVGDISVEVETENHDNIQILAGYDTRLARNFYMSTKVGLNGKEQIRLQLTKRF